MGVKIHKRHFVYVIIETQLYKTGGNENHELQEIS